MSQDPFLDALVERIRASCSRAPDVKAELASAAECAPRAAAVLLRALAEVESVHVDLGSRSIRESSLGGLSDALESAGFEPDNPGWFDASRSVRLGATQEVQFGFHWNDDEVEVVEIEPETARLCRFPTFEAWFRAISGEDC